MALSWKSFDFFDVSQVKLSTEDNNETRNFFESNSIASVCAGSGSLFLGSTDGQVHIVGPSWKIIRTFPAYDGDGGHQSGGSSVTHMRQVEGTSLLVTVAEDLSNEPVLKVWALDKPVKKTGLPTCLSTLGVNNGRKQFPISAFAATDDLSQIAVGFANGAVTVIRGDLIHDRGARQRIVFESDEPITGLELKVDEKLTTLFISTTSRLLKLTVSGHKSGQPPRTVEDQGCGVGCMTVDKSTGDIVVAREDAIYYYTLEGREAPRAYEAAKSLVAVSDNYVAIVSPPESPTSKREPSNTKRRFGGVAGADTLFNASTLALLEPDLRILAHTESVLAPVQAIFEIWGNLHTLTQDGKVFKYHEKPLQQRLEMLYQRNLYPLAVQLAQKAGLDISQQNIIFRKSGDYLYQKGDYDGAMAQYIRAIDNTEPSQVIRKFLDTQRIHNLIEYLEQLHDHGKATADHTTLLLNCYAKLKDVDKLEKFIKQPGDLKFDLDTAIVMCRQGGYYEQAAYLAKKHGEHDLVVDILIEDLKSYDDALNFVWHLDPSAAYPCLMKYARVLIENCPKDATQVFIDYYTGTYRPKRDRAPIDDSVTPSSTGGGFTAGAANAVQNLTNLLPLPYMSSAAVLSPGTLGNIKPGSNDSRAAIAAVAAITEVEDDSPAPKYSPPPPRTAFSSFIDHPDQFITFLEACLQEPNLTKTNRSDLDTTLFEMYLHKASEMKDETRKEAWESKAKALIEGRETSSSIENSNVLLLSHLSNFRDGTTLVKEQSGLLFDIFRSYTSAKDTRGAIRALRKYGNEEPQLYPAALAYLTSDPRVLDEAGGMDGELASILARIERDGLLAPLQVVQMLSKHSVATMGMIKGYLQGTIERERKDIASNRRRVAGFRSETEQRRAEIADLGSKPAIFQATRCPVCTQPLDLPAVHFLCKHSFHQRCVQQGSNINGPGNGQAECPLCARDNATIRNIRQAQEENAERHELFQDELERSEDRFGTVADWFGRGVMGVSQVVD